MSGDPAVLNLIDLLTRLFQQRSAPACHRVVKQLLEHPRASARDRLIAATMQGELYRGEERYEEAEACYRRAAGEGAEVPWIDRDAYYRHYHPRAHLGLITVLRRQLWPDTGEVAALADEFRRTFAGHADFAACQDLGAQIDAVEGVFLRQTGDSPTALARLTAASRAINPLKREYYLFWHPEHIDAHRVLVCLTAPGLGAQGRFGADQLLQRPGADPWSRTAARAARLHFQLDDALYEAGGRPGAVRAALAARGEANPSRQLDLLVADGRSSGDPTLATEGLMLRAAWHAAAGDAAAAVRYLGDLAGQDVDPNLALLRGVEAAVLRDGWPEVASAPGRELCARGLGALDFVADRLGRYNYPSEDHDWCHALLSRHAGAGGAGRSPPRGGSKEWSPAPLVRLRARLWP